jgi:hypothetical protein
MINQLLEAWNERPMRFDPEEVAHLMWVSTKLLPAMRDAMPEIQRMHELQELMGRPTPQVQPPAPGVEFPSTDLPQGQETASNNHSQDSTPSMADNAEVTGQTAGNADTSASSPATGGDKLAALKSKAAKHGRPVSAKKRAAAPRVKPPKTDGTEKV